MAAGGRLAPGSPDVSLHLAIARFAGRTRAFLRPSVSMRGLVIIEVAVLLGLHRLHSAAESLVHHCVFHQTLARNDALLEP